LASPIEAVSSIAKEATFQTSGGIKIRLYRNDPMRFMSEITKFLEGLAIGEIFNVHLSTDANGWMNFVIVYRESSPSSPKADPVLMIYDTLSLLKEVSESVSTLSRLFQDHVEGLPGRVEAE
jgi:hypothetical protein